VLGLIDLDNFKTINDQLGHLVGDKVLQQTSSLIEKNLTGAAILARIGGDEFACLLYYDNLNAALDFLGQLEEKVQQYFAEHNPDWPVSFSFGCALFDPASPVTLEKLYQEADQQMYKRKNHRKAAAA
jgi:diguanylate cyclase (GGDEF)-like protein